MPAGGHSNKNLNHCFFNKIYHSIFYNQKSKLILFIKNRSYLPYHDKFYIFFVGRMHKHLI